MNEWDRHRLESLGHAVFLTLDAARIALDQVSTLLMVTTGGRASGPDTRADRPRRWGLSGAPGYPMGEQLRRARVSLDELATERERLLTKLATSGAPPSGLGVHAEVERLNGWVTPTLETAGGMASIPALGAARTSIAELGSDLTAIDGRLRLALMRLP